MDVIREFEQSRLKKRVTDFQVGDEVEVHVRITEGEVAEELSKTAAAIKSAQGKGKAARERIQIFRGVVIARDGDGLRETFTVRRIVQGEGVERVFPLQSPRVARIKVRRRGRVRRAKLYYLRDRVGKATRLREVRLSADTVLDADDTPEAIAEREAEAKAKADAEAEAKK
jgi:large subunit ribosomal protein L19